MRANETFIDSYNVKRRAGEEYLITMELSAVHV